VDKKKVKNLGIGKKALNAGQRNRAESSLVSVVGRGKGEGETLKLHFKVKNKRGGNGGICADGWNKREKFASLQGMHKARGRNQGQQLKSEIKLRFWERKLEGGGEAKNLKAGEVRKKLKSAGLRGGGIFFVGNKTGTEWEPNKPKLTGGENSKGKD